MSVTPKKRLPPKSQGGGNVKIPEKVYKEPKVQHFSSFWTVKNRWILPQFIKKNPFIFPILKDIKTERWYVTKEDETCSTVYER